MLCCVRVRACIAVTAPPNARRAKVLKYLRQIAVITPYAQV
jgi:DNA topoisomerase VI subunit B